MLLTETACGWRWEKGFEKKPPHSILRFSFARPQPTLEHKDKSPHVIDTFVAELLKNLDFVRYALDLGWPRQITATGGILMRDKESKVNVHDTQAALFDYGDLQVAWNQRNWGANPDPEYPWGATFYGDKGTLKVSVQSFDFVPLQGTPVHRDFVDEREKYP